MYKKISVALCIVISLFFIVPLIYLWLTMESSPPSGVIKGPFIAVYLRNLTSLNNSAVLLYDVPNSDFVLDRYLWEWNNGSSDAQFRQPQHQQKSILLECHSNVPVKLEYRGEGGLVSEMRHHNRREIKSFDDNSTYWFTTSVEMLSINEQITGKYFCSVIEPPSGGEIGVFLHIFVKGYKTFITSDEVRHEVEPDEEIVIPCPISDPDKSGAITLRELLQPLNKEVYHIVDPHIVTEFDPRIGFKLEANHYGSYLCVDSANSETAGIVKIFKPRRLVVDGKYLTRSITNVPIPKNDPALRVLCEATENVTLNFINFLPFKRRQVPYYNDSSTFPHTSRIILRNEWFSNFSTVECLTVQDERVLRVWTYVKKESSDKTNFRFDPVRKGYECCTDPGIIPRLTQATCYTQTECDMKRSCVKLDKKCPLPAILNQPIYEGNVGCAVAKVENNPSGLLECSYGNSTKTYLYIYNRRTGFNNFTSSDFRKKNVPLNKMLRVVQDFSVSYAKDVATFICSGPKFFFANGFQWALKAGKFGAIEHLPNQSEIDEISDEATESVQLPVSKVESKTVICFAPLLYSHDWVNATVKYRSSSKSAPSSTEYDDTIYL
ncbi:uncharacterized protein LOC110853604 isoform X2 [Folsomia candida]|uniref:Macrophage colony-stimulating factor 1 receptor n=1 Tax=Folsomia candida TaxID=158441 RepID=A0A226E269_FOLCA|nr:uncharacterized protein LOC110853604 isoform X2 [Folsomia candida]OXA50576.1 Macrophage colony-stimulating factor 1 receptor [Folsomia candida]